MFDPSKLDLETENIENKTKKVEIEKKVDKNENKSIENIDILNVIEKETKKSEFEDDTI
jgi:hypothetical protein